MTTQLRHSPSSKRWRSDFERHADQHCDVDVTGISRPPGWSALGASLAVFQLGETGSGSKLFAEARRIGCDDGHMIALELFIGEEQEHARLLGLLLEHFDTPLERHHWTDRVFVHARQAFGYRGEVLMLLVAEVVALAYYSTLRDGIDDPRLAEVFARIHADEVRHVRFHGDTLPPLLRRWRRSQWWLARMIWNGVVTGTSIVVGCGHRKALHTCGASVRRFVSDIDSLRRREDARLFGRR